MWTKVHQFRESGVFSIFTFVAIPLPFEGRWSPFYADTFVIVTVLRCDSDHAECGEIADGCIFYLFRIVIKSYLSRNCIINHGCCTTKIYFFKYENIDNRTVHHMVQVLVCNLLCVFFCITYFLWICWIDSHSSFV